MVYRISSFLLENEMTVYIVIFDKAAYRMILHLLFCRIFLLSLSLLIDVSNNIDAAVSINAAVSCLSQFPWGNAT